MSTPRHLLRTLAVLALVMLAMFLLYVPAFLYDAGFVEENGWLLLGGSLVLSLVLN